VPAGELLSDDGGDPRRARGVEVADVEHLEPGGGGGRQEQLPHAVIDVQVAAGLPAVAESSRNTSSSMSLLASRQPLILLPQPPRLDICLTRRRGPTHRLLVQRLQRTLITRRTPLLHCE
jgi:hypothetical protein